MKGGTKSIVVMAVVATVSAAAALGESTQGSGITDILKDGSVASRRIERVPPGTPGKTFLFAQAPAETGKPSINIRIIPTVLRTQSAWVGIMGLHYVINPADAARDQGYIALRSSFAYIDIRHSPEHTRSYGLGVDCQLTPSTWTNSSKKQVSGLPVIVSADMSRSKGGDDLSVFGLEVDRVLAQKFPSGPNHPPSEQPTWNLMIVGTGAYAVARGSGDGHDIISTFETDLLFPVGWGSIQKATLIANYTFDNKLDGESDYYLALRPQIGAGQFLRAGVGKRGRAFLSFIQVF